MKFGICSEIFQGWEIEKILEYASELGYDGVEIAPFTLAATVNSISKTRRREIRDAAARLGVEICGLHWLLAKTEGFSLNDPDPQVRRRTSNYFCDLVECCADLGGKILVLGSPQQRNFSGATTATQAWEFAAATLSDAVRRAEDREAVICFEPLAPSETNFINSAREAVRFALSFDSAAMRIILDVKAMCAEQQPIPEIIRESWPWFAHFHANDRNLKGPGFGQVDFSPIASALNEVGYGGYVSVEVFNFDEGPENIAAQSLNYLRKVFSP